MAEEFFTLRRNKKAFQSEHFFLSIWIGKFLAISVHTLTTNTRATLASITTVKVSTIDLNQYQNILLTQEQLLPPQEQLEAPTLKSSKVMTNI